MLYWLLAVHVKSVDGIGTVEVEEQTKEWCHVHMFILNSYNIISLGMLQPLSKIFLNLHSGFWQQSSSESHHQSFFLIQLSMPHINPSIQSVSESQSPSCSLHLLSKLQQSFPPVHPEDAACYYRYEKNSVSALIGKYKCVNMCFC